jgi:hypothetical protein
VYVNTCVCVCVCARARVRVRVRVRGVVGGSSDCDKPTRQYSCDTQVATSEATTVTALTLPEHCTIAVLVKARPSLPCYTLAVSAAPKGNGDEPRVGSGVLRVRNNTPHRTLRPFAD